MGRGGRIRIVRCGIKDHLRFGQQGKEPVSQIQRFNMLPELAGRQIHKGPQIVRERAVLQPGKGQGPADVA